MYRIGEAATRCGTTEETLRTWDRRYGLGPSGRTAGGHRLYSESDVALVRRVRELSTCGYALSAAVSAARDELMVPRVLVEDRTGLQETYLLGMRAERQKAVDLRAALVQQREALVQLRHNRRRARREVLPHLDSNQEPAG